jgi:asparaginyl-tRNA synthetase
MEPEIAFADLNDEMQLSEDMLKYVLKHLLKTCRPELEFFNKFIDNTLLERFENVINSDFARITYTDAMKLLAESGKKFEYPVGWGEDLQTEHERYLTEEYFKKPVFVTDWPREIKAFYMRLNDDGRTVAAADMLVPGVGELCGGSQREERMDYLLDALNRFGLDEDDYWWYLELRKYGGTKHAGFGLGFERLIMYVTGINNIRDVEAFPRTTGNADF